MNGNFEASFKIITIGNCGVGKTSIFQRFIYDTFNNDLISTIGINYTCKDITLSNDKIVQLKLFDTAGQERYHSLTKSYYKNADAVLFVYAINDIKSFENIKDWIQLYMNNNYGNNNNYIPLYLIENKNDLNREVNQNLIDDFLNNNNFIFKSISAKLNENNSINQLFMELSELLYNNYEEFKRIGKKQKSLRIRHFVKQKKPKCKCGGY